jgi:hypothetical protein
VISEIAIKIEPAQGPLKRIDRAVSILVEFLEMLMEQRAGVRVWNPSFAMLIMRGIPLRLLKHAMIGHVRLWGERGLRPERFSCSRAAMRAAGRRFLCRPLALFEGGTLPDPLFFGDPYVLLYRSRRTRRLLADSRAIAGDPSLSH